MTLEQRAQQFWPVLVFAAREQKLLSYLTLLQLTGFPETSRVLYYIHCYCKQNDLPSLTDIVIDPATGRPGDECPRDLRVLSAQQSRVFLFEWLNHPAPSAGMFQEAMQKEEDLERASAEYVGLPC